MALEQMRTFSVGFHSGHSHWYHSRLGYCHCPDQPVLNYQTAPR